MDDGKIIDMFFARNEDAIRHTDAAYGRRLYHLADRIVENGQDAEESVSDTYLKAWNTIPPKRPEHFFAYIAKICRNFALKKVVWKNAQKRKAEVVTLTQEMENCIPDTYQDSAADARELGQFWTHSSEPCPRTIRWSFSAGIGTWIPSRRLPPGTASAKVPYRCG